MICVSVLVFEYWMKLNYRIVALIGTFLFSWVSFWYLEKSLYCYVDENVIQVFMYKKWAYKCIDYVASFDNSIRSLYQDIVMVQGFIDRNQDIEYWQETKLWLIQKHDDLKNLRNNVLFRVQSFEDNLFNKINDYLYYYLTPYEEELEAQLLVIENIRYQEFTWELVILTAERVVSIKNQLRMISDILRADDFEELLSYIWWYFYLKQEIEWK